MNSLSIIDQFPFYQVSLNFLKGLFIIVYLIILINTKYLFSAINKQLTYILKKFLTTMPLSWVVSLKKKFLRFPQHFPYPFVLKLEECCLFLLLAWRVEMMYEPENRETLQTI